MPHTLRLPIVRIYIHPPFKRGVAKPSIGFYVKLTCFEERDVFVTDDRSLLAVCRYLHDEFGFAIKAMSLADYLDSRAA